MFTSRRCVEKAVATVWKSINWTVANENWTALNSNSLDISEFQKRFSILFGKLFKVEKKVDSAFLQGLSSCQRFREFSADGGQLWVIQARANCRELRNYGRARSVSTALDLRCKKGESPVRTQLSSSKLKQIYKLAYQKQLAIGQKTV